MKRKYKVSTEFVVGAVACCLRQARSLLQSAELLFNNGSYPLALSVSVLALEEIGKLMYLDILAFSNAGDYKSIKYENSKYRHSEKLNVLALFPDKVEYFSTLDPRATQHPEQFRTALIITLREYFIEMKTLERWLGADFSLTHLNEWKKDGIYSRKSSDGFYVVPDEIIDKEFAGAVLVLARRFVTTFEFLIGNNLPNYQDFIASIRDKFSESDHLFFEEQTGRTIDQLFGTVESGGDNESAH